MGNPNGHVVHGMWGTGAYKSWCNMRTRVLNEHCKDHHYYKKIFGFIEPRWEAFEEFYKDMGDRPDGLTLDRIDNSKGYFPWNCRWATRKQQANNKKWGGKCKLTQAEVLSIYCNTAGMTTREVGKLYGVSSSVISSIKRGLSWKGVTANV
jgi:hypothetical protein